MLHHCAASLPRSRGTKVLRPALASAVVTPPLGACSNRSRQMQLTWAVATSCCCAQKGSAIRPSGHTCGATNCRGCLAPRASHRHPVTTSVSQAGRQAPRSGMRRSVRVPAGGRCCGEAHGIRVRLKRKQWITLTSDAAACHLLALMPALAAAPFRPWRWSIAMHLVWSLVGPDCS